MAVIVIVDSAVAVRSRSGRDISSRVPELARLADVLAGHSVVLDGELIAGEGRACDFYQVAPRLAASPRRAGPSLRLAMFDVLWLDGSLCRRSYSERRALLEGLVSDGPGWLITPSFDCPPGDLLAACAGLGLEGIVAKRATSLYHPGRRSPDWVKMKTGHWRADHAPRRRPAQHIPRQRQPQVHLLSSRSAHLRFARIAPAARLWCNRRAEGFWAPALEGQPAWLWLLWSLPPAGD